MQLPAKCNWRQLWQVSDQYWWKYLFSKGFLLVVMLITDSVCSLSETYNEFDGSFQCKEGFGGRQCNECLPYKSRQIHDKFLTKSLQDYSCRHHNLYITLFISTYMAIWFWIFKVNYFRLSYSNVYQFISAVR